ncbi:type II secretion system F family protein [Candidatus Micrarchaeota archaeon]|nr:type II secretion system F family protein [Candidatus Micrarchaeota archaeon]
MPSNPPRGSDRKEKEKGIATVETLYKADETVAEVDLTNKYQTFKSATRFFAKRFASYGKGQKFTPEQAEVFAFLDLDVAAEDFYAASRGLFLFSIAIGVLLFVAAYYFLSDAIGLYNTLLMGLVFMFIPMAIALFYQKYPKMAADKEKLLALAYVPEIVNYLVMSMRLNPNLERAVEFAANHGRGRIADELKKIIWLVQIGKYSSVEEALDDLAYRWGPYSEDFKQALMTIRASVLEADKIRRQELLEKAVTDVLEGSKEKMDLYARGLHQPTVFLYYFGIMLPLMLAIILPIGAAFVKDAQFAKAEYIFILYCVVLPAGVYMYGNSILSGRPPTYVAPEIPENYPGLPKKGLMKIGGILIPYAFAALFTFFLVSSLGFAADFLQEQSIPAYNREVLEQIPQVALPFGFTIRMFGIFGMIIGVSLAMGVYLWGKYSARKKAQDEIREMEIEFKDAVYVLASRLGENKPMEEAIKQAIDFLPRSKVAARVFKTILENVSMLGMTIESAVFDGTYGALKNLPSQTIRSGMRIMVDSVEIGVNVAAKSLISLSMQIRNAHKIDEMLKRLLSDITVLLSTMAVFVAPIVLAVVSSLQTVIINSISSVSFGGAAETNVNVPGFNTQGISSLFGQGDVAGASASPGEFLLIMGLYLIEIVTLLVYFNSQIEDSNNKLHTYTAIAKSIPVATIIFCVVAFLTNYSLAGIAK